MPAKRPRYRSHRRFSSAKNNRSRTGDIPESETSAPIANVLQQRLQLRHVPPSHRAVVAHIQRSTSAAPVTPSHSTSPARITRCAHAATSDGPARAKSGHHLIRSCRNRPHGRRSIRAHNVSSTHRPDEAPLIKSRPTRKANNDLAIVRTGMHDQYPTEGDSTKYSAKPADPISLTSITNKMIRFDARGLSIYVSRMGVGPVITTGSRGPTRSAKSLLRVKTGLIDSR